MAADLDYRLVLERFADAVVAADERDRIVYVNQAAEALLGWPREQLLELPMAAIMPERFRAAHSAGMKRFLSTRQPKIIGKPVRVPVLRQDGSEVDIELTLSVFPNGEHDLFVASLRDLRDRVELEQQIRTNRRVLAQHEVMRSLVNATSLAEAAPAVLQAIGGTLEWDVGAFWLSDDQSNLLWPVSTWSAEPVRFAPFIEQTLSMRMERGTGLPGRTWTSAQVCWMDDVTQGPAASTYFPRRPTAAATGLRGAIAIPIHVGERVLGVAEFFSTEARQPDEELLRVAASIGGYIGQFLNRLHIEEALRLSEERFRLLVARLQDYAIVMLDPEGRVTSWNEGAERIKGYTEAEIVGKHFSIFYPEEDVRAGMPEQALKIATAEGRHEEDGWRVRRDGSRFWANVVMTAIHDERGVLRGFGKVARDVTERRAAEEERERLLAELREALHARDEFLSIASHELKTPLTSVKLSVAALERNAGSATSITDAARVDRIRRQIDRLNKLVTSLLDISRITAKRLEFALEDVDFGAVLQDSLSQFKDDLNRANCALRLRADTQVIGRWDRLRLDQLVANLLSNAIKYGRGKPIEVDLQKAGGVARLTVRDYGIGISQEDQSRIFARFERAVPLMHYGGFGLGLWITRQVVDGLGGRISVESHVNQGSTFTVELPLAGPPASAQDEAPGAEQPKPPSPPLFKS